MKTKLFAALDRYAVTRGEPEDHLKALEEMRSLVREIREGSKTAWFASRRFASGLLFDALLFNPDLNPHQVEVVRKAFEVIGGDLVGMNYPGSLRRTLIREGFALNPSPLNVSDFPPGTFDPCKFCGKIAPFGGCCQESMDFSNREADAAPICPDQDCISNTHLRGDGGRMKCDPNTHQGRRVLTEAERDAGAERFLKALFPERKP